MITLFILLLVSISFSFYVYKLSTHLYKTFDKSTFIISFLTCVHVIVITTLIAIGVNSGSEIIAKMDAPIKISTELTSKENTQDSTINDSILYKYLSDMRVPHRKIVFAQAKLESNNYQSELFKSNFNLFGMKVATIRVSNTDNENKGYQAYCNWRESVTDYVLWQFENNVDKLSDEEYLYYLSKKYAEDPQYIEKIKKLTKNL